MFGTLVIQLPSDYEGGMLRVRHRGEELTFDYSGLKGIMDFNYATFYADCEHELCEVTRGYRLCLVYNLVYRGDGACPAPIDNSKAIAKVVAGMRAWEQDDDGPPFLAYALDHNYCEASQSFRLLKNGDRAKGEILLEAEKQNNFCLFFGTISLYQHCSMGGYGYTCEELSVDYIDDEDLTVGMLVSPTGKTLDEIELTQNLIVPEDLFEGEADEEDFESYTGNAGATLDRTYRKGALFIWPSRHNVIVTGLDNAIEELSYKLHVHSESQDAQELGECECLAKEIVAVSMSSYFSENADDKLIITILSCLKRLKAKRLACEFLKAIAVYHLDLLQNQPFSQKVIELGNSLGWNELDDSIVVLFENAVSKGLNTGACSFLTSLATTDHLSPQRREFCQKLVNTICTGLNNEQDIAQNGAQGSRSKNFICNLFKTFLVLGCEDQLGVALESVFRQPKRYLLDNALVPAALELHESMKEGINAPLLSLLSHCVSTLEKYSQQAPTWFVQVSLGCRCELCTQLAGFLKNTQKSITRFRTKQSNRFHLEQQLRNCRDVSCATERDSIPHVLVVTKSQSLYQARVKKHQTRLAFLNRMRPLLNQEKPVKRLKVED